MKRRKILFVTYGGGHVSMVVPVALAVQRQGLADVQVLALTTAASVTRAAGLPTLQFRDFVEQSDGRALAWGSQLAARLEPNPLVEPEETRAYLGLSFADLVEDRGLDGAQALYEQYGRHCFLPQRTLCRIIGSVGPDLVVMTNSPRAERAAGLAARRLGVPALCINSLFAIDEIAWIGQRGFCDRVCVINEAVRQSLIRAGRCETEVVVTGNPSFDALGDASVRQAGLCLRERLGAQVRHVVLWGSQAELVSHPTAPGRVGDPELPCRILQRLLDWADRDAARHVLIRPHPNEPEPPRIGSRVGCATVVAAPEWDIGPLLHACDVLVTMTSTVAVQAHAVGKPVLQVRGSIFDHSMPLHAMGMADECAESDVASALDRLFAKGLDGRAHIPGDSATDRVVGQISQLLQPDVALKSVGFK